jgi:hypothetical protein
MAACSEEFAEMLARLRNRAGTGDTDAVEAEQACLMGEFPLEINRRRSGVQKSRST